MLKTNKAMIVMNMPASCETCMLCAQFHDNLYCGGLPLDGNYISEDDAETKRLPNCPLIPVTEDMERYLEFYQNRILGNMPGEGEMGECNDAMSSVKEAESE